MINLLFPFADLLAFATAQRRPRHSTTPRLRLRETLRLDLTTVRATSEGIDVDPMSAAPLPTAPVAPRKTKPPEESRRRTTIHSTRRTARATGTRPPITTKRKKKTRRRTRTRTRVVRRRCRC